MKTKTRKLIMKTKGEIGMLERILERNEALQLEMPGMENLVKNHAYWSADLQRKRLYLAGLLEAAEKEGNE